MQAYPQSRLQDIYKYFYQAHFGAEHLISDTAAVRAFVAQELAASELSDLLDAPYSEPVGLNGEYVRVSFRGLAEHRFSDALLSDLFIAGSHPRSHPSKSWADEWQTILAAVRNAHPAPFGWEKDEAELTDASLHDYAVHHSNAYRNAYHPHYRLVSADLFEQEIRPLLPEPKTGEDLLDILNDEHLSLVVYKNDSLRRYTRSRVDDLMDLNRNHPELLQGALVADKRIGNAAAVLLAHGGVREVHTNMVTHHAKHILNRAGVRLVYNREGDYILNRDGSAQCPMDASLNDVTDPQEGYLILRRDFYTPKHAAQGEALLQIVNANHLSLVVFNDDSLSTYSDRGVQDLLRLLKDEPKRLEGALVADKIIGKAAASLMIAGGVKEVHTNIICTLARELFDQAGVVIVYQEEVPQILNRDRSGQCPIDSRLNDAETTEECVTILRTM